MPQQNLTQLILFPKYLFHQVVNMVGIVRLFSKPNECLYTAIETNSPFWVKVAIKYGADINGNYGRGISALHLAAKLGKIDIVRLLIQKYNANIHATGEIGRTPLFLAFQRGKIKTARVLIQEFNAPINTTNMWGESPLHIATKKGKAAKMALLVNEFHVDVNATDKFGKAPLHYAVREGDLSVVKLLIEDFHANVNVKNKRGITPLRLAAFKGHLNVVNYLLELDVIKAYPETGQDVATDNNIALQKAVKISDFDTVKRLLSFDEVKQTLISNSGHILTIAQEKNRTDIMTLLMNAIAMKQPT